MKFCVDCRHHEVSPTDIHACRRPWTDLVTGESRVWASCPVERTEDGSAYCGPDARFFGPKQP